jgi:predicted NBD/HSP70 family sugar kinase
MPSVMEITDVLIGEGLIREIGRGPSTGGRPPLLVELVPDAYCAIGVEVGARTLTTVVTDLNAKVEFRSQSPSPMKDGPGRLLEQLKTNLREAFEHVPSGTGRHLGIGLALPAPILLSEGVFFSPPSFPGWGRLQLADMVAEDYGFQVLVDNDANAAALGEHLFGAGRGAENMFYVIMNRGVGGAAIVEGGLYRGANGGAGEIGHTLVDLEGPKCGCGRYGCLEAFAGRAAIAARARRALKLAGSREMAGRDPDQVKIDDVIEAAVAGDELAVEILRETGEYTGMGISNMVNFLDPELVVVGGATMKASDLILQPASEVVRRRALPGMADRVKIVAGELGQNASAVGAAALVLRNLFAIAPPRRGTPGNDKAADTRL